MKKVKLLVIFMSLALFSLALFSCQNDPKSISPDAVTRKVILNAFAPDNFDKCIQTWGSYILIEQRGSYFPPYYESQKTWGLTYMLGYKDMCRFAVNLPHSHRENSLKSKYKVVRNDGTTATVEVTYPDGKKEQINLVRVASGWKVTLPVEMLSTVPPR